MATCYRQVKNKIHGAIAREFGIPVDKLYLTSPTFFSKMTPRPAQTIHDEYWHVHVDKVLHVHAHPPVIGCVLLLSTRCT